MVSDAAGFHSIGIRLFEKTIKPNGTIEETELCMEV
jgi:hypothetical protein